MKVSSTRSSDFVGDITTDERHIPVVTADTNMKVNFLQTFLNIDWIQVTCNLLVPAPPLSAVCLARLIIKH